jgi:ArsR family transcriptional regulator
MHTSTVIGTSKDSRSVVGQVAESLRAAADETRLRLLRLLAVGSPLCVCEMAQSLHVPHYTISRQLNTLRRAGLVESRREGTYVFYSIAKSPAAYLLEPVFRRLSDANGKDPILADDASRLRRIVQLRDSQARLTAYCEVVEPSDGDRVQPQWKAARGFWGQERG